MFSMKIEILHAQKNVSYFPQQVERLDCRQPFHLQWDIAYNLGQRIN